MPQISSFDRCGSGLLLANIANAILSSAGAAEQLHQEIDPSSQSRPVACGAVASPSKHERGKPDLISVPAEEGLMLGELVLRVCAEKLSSSRLASGI